METIQIQLGRILRIGQMSICAHRLKVRHSQFSSDIVACGGISDQIKFRFESLVWL